LPPVVTGYQNLGAVDDFSIADEGGRPAKLLIVWADDNLLYPVFLGEDGDLGIKPFCSTVYPGGIGELCGDEGELRNAGGLITVTGECNVHSSIVAH